MNSSRHTFPKAEKLKSRKQIDLLFQGGKSFFAAPVKCYYRLTSLEVDELTGLPADRHGLQVDELTGLPADRHGLPVDGLTGLPADRHGLLVDELIGVKPEMANVRRPELVEGKGETYNGNNEFAGENATSNIKHQTSNLNTSNIKRQTSNLLAGVSVSKRNFKHSVDRNRIKRLLREAYRLHKHSLQEKLHTQNKTLEVFFVFTDKTLPDFAIVEDKMKYCIRRLGKIVEGGV
jgi:ribonuclease P protein component